jgi:hypothetical protein
VLSASRQNLIPEAQETVSVLYNCMGFLRDRLGTVQGPCGSLQGPLGTIKNGFLSSTPPKRSLAVPAKNHTVPGRSLHRIKRYHETSFSLDPHAVAISDTMITEVPENMTV